MQSQEIIYTLHWFDRGGWVTRKLLAFIPLMVGLVGCNLLGSNAAVTGPVPTEGDSIQATAEGTPALAEIVPVPTSLIQIEGMPYIAYQIPGDPFRIVCQEPCPLDEQYILAEYAGFRLAHSMLIELTGIDTLPELQPVDMHLDFEDSICSELPVGHANVYAHTHQAYTCTDGPGYYPTIDEKIRMAARPEGQYFPLHEYMHTIFFGRISGRAGDFQDYKAAWVHDYVVPLPSYALGLLDRAGFCSLRNDPPPGDYDGWLINELCRQNGFELAHIALSLIALDDLVRSGGGQDVQEGYEQPVPTVEQYRDILNSLLGSDTMTAFADACWPPQLFGNSYSVRPACVVETIEGTATPVQ